MEPVDIIIIHLVVIDIVFSDDSIKDNKQSRTIKDTDLFNSALNQPKQTFDGIDLYPDIISKASCYLRSFAMDHPFFDGNKRTALMSAVIFLERNGYEITADNNKMYKFVENIVINKLSVEEISNKLKKIVKPRRKRGYGWNNFVRDIGKKIKK